MAQLATARQDPHSRGPRLSGATLPWTTHCPIYSTPPTAEPISRRQLLRALGVVAVGAPFAAALGQGRCRLRLGALGCDTTAIKPVFEPTGWKTVLLDHLSMQVVDYQKEAAFFNALMGWKIRSDDGKQAVLDIGELGSIVIRGGLPRRTAGRAGDGRQHGRRSRWTCGGRGGGRAMVESFCFGIEPWDAKTVEAELRKRGLTPVADNDGKGFESFHVKDPDGFDLQISNGSTAERARTTPANATASRRRAPFESTGWQTVWLDHISFGVANYKESVSFYVQPARLEADVRRGQPERVHDRRRRRHHHPRRQSARPDVRHRRRARRQAAAPAGGASITSRSASRRGTRTR